MKNSLVCKNCNSENPFYYLICSNCKSYLRERIFNIDLWKVFGLLVDEPVKGYKIIIQSEHKNFIFFILIFASIKFFIDSMFMSLFTITAEPVYDHLIRNYFIVLGEILLLIFLFAYLLTKVNKYFGLTTRIRDNFSILTFSFMPQIFALFIIFTVEVTVFGGSIFSKNPSVFSLKQSFALIFTGFEALVVLWGIFLMTMAVYSQSKNFLYSFPSALIFSSLLYLCIYLNSIYLFK